MIKINLVRPPKNKTYTIIIVGCGGTGSWVTRDVLRSVTASGRKHKVILVDGDSTEPKNLVRQNFIEKDLGLNKARVLAGRYGSYFRNVEVVAVPEYIEKAAKLKTIIGKNTPIFIGCVDNNKSRKIIYDVYKEIPNSWWIDSGNEQINGQVICGYNNPKDKLPCVADIFPAILDGKDRLPNELSCAEHAESSPQHMYVNNVAATIVINYLNKVLWGEPIGNYVVYFSVDNIFKTIINNDTPATVTTVEPRVEEGVKTDIKSIRDLDSCNLKELHKIARTIKAQNKDVFGEINFYRVNRTELLNLLRPVITSAMADKTSGEVKQNGENKR